MCYIANSYSDYQESNVAAKRLALDPYIVTTLMPDLVGHDKQPSAFLVYLYLWSRRNESRDRRVVVSHQRMSEDTGLSKSAVQAAVRTLSRRRLIRSERASVTAVPSYEALRPWKRKISRSRSA